MNEDGWLHVLLVYFPEASGEPLLETGCWVKWTLGLMQQSCSYVKSLSLVLPQFLAKKEEFTSLPRGKLCNEIEHM